MSKELREKLVKLSADVKSFADAMDVLINSTEYWKKIEEYQDQESVDLKLEVLHSVLDIANDVLGGAFQKILFPFPDKDDRKLLLYMSGGLRKDPEGRETFKKILKDFDDLEGITKIMSMIIPLSCGSTLTEVYEKLSIESKD